MNDDDFVAVIAWLLAALAVSAVVSVAVIAIVAVAAIGAVLVVIGSVLRIAFNACRNLIQGAPAEREVNRVARERNAAIHDIVAIRHAAERRMRDISRRPGGR